MDLEFVLIDFLVESGLIDDTVVTINKMLLDFVRKNTFNRVTFIAFSNFSNNISDLYILF